jgi:glycosyltransferase involved in cell wall biosynthesis
MTPRVEAPGVVLLTSRSAQLTARTIALSRVASALTRYRPHVVLGEEGPLVERLASAGITVEVLGVTDVRWGLRLAARRISEIAPCLVHTSDPASGTRWSVAARISRLPVVWHAHDDLRGPNAAWTRAVVRGVASIAIVDSRSTRATLPRNVPVAVIPSPIASDMLERLPIKQRIDQPLTFLTVGPLAPRKGQHVVLDAFARAFACSEHRLVLISEPPLDEYGYADHLAREAQRLGLEGRIAFTTHASRLEHLAESDVLIDGSDAAEPLTLTVAEGLAAGIPVIATDSGGPAEAIRHLQNGLLYRAGDAEALAAALSDVAADPYLRQNLGVRGRTSAEVYRPERVAPLIERVNDCALAGRPGRARHIVVNGRYSGREVTGVERFAANTTSRLHTPLRTVRSPRWLGQLPLLGHAWEQFSLPLFVGREGLLWSPCNFGPLGLRRQVVTVHDIAPIEHGEWFSRAYRSWFRFVVPRLVTRARLVTTVSAFTRARLTSLLGVDPESVRIVPNGCDLNASAPTLSSANQDPYILTVGSSDPRKNLTVVEAALGIVRTTHPRVRWLRAGAPTRAVFATSHDVQSTVDAQNRVTDEDLQSLYRSAACLVYPSFYEGFGLPPLEAMAVGTRVVASRIDPIEEVCGDVAIYVDPHDAADVARGIKHALEEPPQHRRAVIESGLARARGYNWTRTASELDALIVPLLLEPAGVRRRTPRRKQPDKELRSRSRTPGAVWR